MTLRLRPAAVLLLPAVLAASLALVGCTASDDRAASPSASASTSAAELDRDADIRACEQVGDAETVLFNQSIAFRDGRVSEQEMRGARGLAARLLLRIDTDRTTDVSRIVARAQKEAGDESRALAEAFDVADASTPAWSTGLHGDDNLQTACNEVKPGHFGVAAWTGG